MRVVGVELDKNGRVHYFDAVELQLEKRDLVVVDAEQGITMGTVVSAPQEEKSGLFKRSLQKVIRKATAKDVTRSVPRPAHRKGRSGGLRPEPSQSP